MPDNATIIATWLRARPRQWFCARCIMTATSIEPFQQVNQIIRQIENGTDFRYTESLCSSCREERKCIGFLA
jgi:hypothetical protein